MPPAHFVTSDWVGIGLGLLVLTLAVVLARILPPLRVLVAPFYDATRIYFRLLAISLPMLVIGGLLIAWLLGQQVSSEILRTMIPAIVVVLGWFITFIFQEDRRITERRDDLQFVHVDCGVQNLQLGLSAGAAQPPAPGSVVLNFSVEGDIEAVRARLEARGVRFSGPTQVIPGKVRLAGFTDPDGYRLRLAGRP